MLPTGLVRAALDLGLHGVYGHPEPGGYDYARMEREERGAEAERAMDEERERS